MGDWFKKIKPGDYIGVNYGKSWLKVIKKEKLEKGLARIQTIKSTAGDLTKSEMFMPDESPQQRIPRRKSEYTQKTVDNLPDNISEGLLLIIIEPLPSPNQQTRKDLPKTTRDDSDTQNSLRIVDE